MKKGQPDMTGQKFGKWTLLKRIPAEGHGGHLKYRCRCDCGVVKEIRAADLVKGRSVQCSSCSQKSRRKTEALEIAKQEWNTPSYPRLIEGVNMMSPHTERRWNYSEQDYLKRMQAYERMVAPCGNK